VGQRLTSEAETDNHSKPSPKSRKAGWPEYYEWRVGTEAASGGFVWRLAQCRRYTKPDDPAFNEGSQKNIAVK
jgi:hypothetical protein